MVPVSCPPEVEWLVSVTPTKVGAQKLQAAGFGDYTWLPAVAGTTLSLLISHFRIDRVLARTFLTLHS